MHTLQGQSIWLSTGTDYLPVILLSTSQSTSTVLLQGEQVSVNHERLFCMGKPSTEKNLCKLSELNQAEILAHLQRSFINEHRIYTALGDTLLAINPYTRSLPPPRQDSPQIRNIASRMLLALDQANQVALITGESGAGKTESAKVLLQELVELSTGEKWLEERVLMTTPIMEAFGNAKTIHNDNSSRFGKYLKLQFQEGRLVGASFQCFLLEKARITNLAPNQRNFHVLYGLVKNHNIRKEYGLPPLLHSTLLGECHENGSVNDEALFEEVLSAFKHLKFSKTYIKKILLILQTILLLGSLAITGQQQCHIEETQLHQACSLLNLDQSAVRDLILYKVRLVGKDRIVSPLGKEGCMTNLHSLLRLLYAEVFMQLIEKTNRCTRAYPQRYQKEVSILDIFGFENFPVNSFEQLNINYTNEKLQQLYCSTVISSQLALLQSDGILLPEISPPDNQELVHLFEAEKGLYRLLDDISSLGSAKDEGLIAASRRFIISSRFKPGHLNDSFTILHSHEPVVYQVNGFKAKNSDSVSREIRELVNLILDKCDDQQQYHCKLSLGRAFLRDMSVLFSQIGNSSAHFIKCIKPNSQQRPFLFDRPFVLRQLRYQGIPETVKVRKMIRPHRMRQEDFCLHYARSDFGIGTCRGNSQEQTAFLLKGLGLEGVIGREYVYFEEQAMHKLREMARKQEQLRQKAVLRIQRFIRAKLFKSRVLKTLRMLSERKRQLAGTLLRIFLTAFSQALRKLSRWPGHETHREEHRDNLYVSKVHEKPRRLEFGRVIENHEEFQSVGVGGNDGFLLRGMLRVGSGACENEDLRQVLQSRYQQPFIEPLKNSEDCGFKATQALSEKNGENIFIKYFEGRMRQKRSFFGVRTGQDILKYRNKPLTQALIVDHQQDQKAQHVFKLILQILTDHDPQTIVRLTLQILVLARQTSLLFKSEILSQLVKQIRGNTEEEEIIRLHQLALAVLHLYRPERDCLIGLRAFLIGRLNKPGRSPREREYSAVLCARVVHALQAMEREQVVVYLPTLTQLKALMCKKQMAVGVCFCTGSKVSVYIEPFQTFRILKKKVLEQVKAKRPFIHNLFGIFQISNVHGKPLEETPIADDQVVWDLLSYEERLKAKYRTAGQTQPTFIFMLKLSFPYQISRLDRQSIDLVFAQGYFEYIVGKLELGLSEMVQIAMCIRQLNNRLPVKLEECPAKVTLPSLSNLMLPSIDNAKILAIQYFSQCQQFLKYTLPVTFRGESCKVCMDTQQLRVLGSEVRVRVELRRLQRWRVMDESSMCIVEEGVEHELKGEFICEINDYIVKSSELLARCPRV